MLLPQSYQYQNLSDGADRVGGQLHGDEECPFSGITKSGRDWRKVPESNAQSVGGGCQENVSCSKVLNFLERLDHRIRCIIYLYKYICLLSPSPRF